MLEVPLLTTMHLVGGPTVLGVHDAGGRDLAIEGEVTLFVEVSVPYHGAPVESARILNGVVLSWVDSRLSALDEIARPHVVSFLSEYYPEVDPGDMLERGTHLIWYDQVDYLASIQEREQLVHFSLEVRPSLEPL